jgi:hypothetical protein
MWKNLSGHPENWVTRKGTDCLLMRQTVEELGEIGRITGGSKVNRYTPYQAYLYY